ncbi:MAG: YbaK/EbsC family protein [Chloroflexi bacterium]|nr:MAG: YbaK/EbsC family protein [Chloroflexota bacterium]
MTDAGHPSVQRVLDAAKEQGLRIEIGRFPEGTRTAADAARAVGCSVGQIVKSLVFVADEQPILVLVSGADRADLDLLSAVLGIAESSPSSPIRRATADEARDATGFAIGGIPPIGHARALPVLIDEGLLRHEVVWAAAGLPDAVFAVAPDDLARAARARVVAIARADPSGS